MLKLHSEVSLTGTFQDTITAYAANSENDIKKTQNRRGISQERAL